MTTESALTTEWRRLRQRPPWLALLAVAISCGPLLLSPRGELSPVALIPPCVALGIVLFTQRVVPAMLLGVLVGSALVHGPLFALPSAITDYFFARLVNPTNLCISGFALSVLLTVKLAEASGGMQGLIAPVRRRLKSARATLVGAATLGLLVFFDDYANTMLVGPSVRPIADRQGISREKLAYIVDSTAAPVAGLAIVSTWLGYEVGLLETTATNLGVEPGGYTLLLSALPERFYCLFALTLVFVIALSGRDFGPMLKAERRTRAALARAVQRPESSEDSATTRFQWLNAALPVAVLTLGIATGFFIDGGGPSRLARTTPLSLEFWQQTLGDSRNGPQVLFFAGATALMTAALCALLSKKLQLGGLRSALWGGLQTVSLPIAILYCAWALGDVAKDLQTGNYLVELLRGEIAPGLVPLFTFLLASMISFATGTSWGTMGILIPAALPLAYELGGVALMIPAIAAVLDGAIFGDHCSPLSDTTLLSSAACECNALHHVSTQLPYAITAMVIATAGYVLIGMADAPLLAVYGGALLLLVLIVRVFGKRPESAPGKLS